MLGLMPFDDETFCAVCGLELVGDPDEDPIGPAGQPMCGNCVRSREEFALDIEDGELDGEYG